MPWLSNVDHPSFNPYFTGLPILINRKSGDTKCILSFNPYFTGLPILMAVRRPYTSLLSNVSILILLDYLFLYNMYIKYY